MIKAKKGLIITLFAAMMVFAFGATSAFATAVDGEWLPDYSGVKYDKVTYPATRTIQSDGIIKAEADFTEYYTHPDIKPVYFYDFSGAALTVKGNYDAVTDFNAAIEAAQNKVIIATPTYVDNASTAAKTYTVTLKGWKNKVTSDYDKDNPAAQTVTVTGVITADGESAGTPTAPWCINKSTITKSVNVGKTAGKTAFWKDATSTAEGGVFITEAPGTFNVSWRYNGEAHKVVNTVADDHAVTWEVLNSETGRYDSASECPSVTNKADAYTVKATDTWTQTTGDVTTVHKDVYKFNLSVTAVNAPPSFEWAEGNSQTWFNNAYTVTEEQAKDPTAFIEFSNRLGSDGLATTDIDTIKAFFNDRYAVEVSKNAIDANQQTWTIVDNYNKMTDAEKEAFAKKYKTLCENYGFAAASGLSGAVSPSRSASVTVTVVADPEPVLQDDIVDITYAPAKVTYKAKKLKKSAKSFTVESTTKSGKAVTYSLKTSSKKITIDSATGKVTVGKKLKKGTYKITVIARTADGQGYKAAQDTAAITIKVKK